MSFDLDAWKQQLREIPKGSFQPALRAMFSERDRRNALPQINARENELAVSYHEANPAEVDSEWGYPVWYKPGAPHEAWPIDSVVVHEGSVWQNVSDATTMDEPGTVDGDSSWIMISE